MPAEADATVILLHGRDQSPAEIIEDVMTPLEEPGTAWLVPHAPGGSWYPHVFDEELERNQPQLDAALQRIETLVTSSGCDPRTTVIVGFSQGACLACEVVARLDHQWGGLVAFTGGRMGGSDTDHSIRRDLAGMPAVFTSGEDDPWIAPQSVRSTATVFGAAGASVTLECFPGDGDHLIRPAEVERLREVIVGIRAHVDQEVE